MAQIAKYVAQEGLNPGSAPSVQIDNTLGQAVQGLGGAIGNLGEVIARKNQQKEDFAAENNYRRLQLQFGQGLADQAENIAPDGSGFHDQFMSQVYTPERDKFLASVPPRLREKYATLLGDSGVDTEAWSIKAATTERDQTHVWYKQEVGATQEQLANAIAQDPEGYDKYLQQGIDVTNASGLDTKAKMEQNAAWERMAQVAWLNRQMEIAPENVIKTLNGDPRYLSPTTQFEMLKKSVIVQESGGDGSQVSPKGAIGLMQVMPGTARDIAREIKDPNFDPRWDPQQISEYLSNDVVNQRYGDYYLKKMIRQYGKTGGVEAALIAYNGGPKRAEEWIKSGFDDSVLPAETRNYYHAIMSRLPGTQASGKVGDPKSVELVFAGRRGVTFNDDPNVNSDLKNRVQTSFAALGIKKVRITSGYRSAEHNAEVGGAKGSQHIHGNAMDIDVSGYSIPERVQIIRTLSANGITGLGIGTNIIHADLGGRRAWGYANSAGGGPVPKWAQAAIADHMANRSTAPVGVGVGASGRFASLPYSDRQTFIRQADQAITQQYNENSKATAVQRVELRQSMDNELASLRTSGQTTGRVDDTTVSTVLGEDDYVRWMAQKEQAVRMFTARQGLATATTEEMNQRLEDYAPVPGSPTFADDIQVHEAVQKEVDRVTKLRAQQPDKAAMDFPEVRQAYDKVQTGMQQGNLNPDDAQAFVKAMIDRQKEFNLKPGSEAPVPREWGMEIGKALSRVPEISGRNLPDVNAAIIAQYQALQKVFGPYTEEVILYALGEYKGIGKNTGDLIIGYMQAIEAGGDPFHLRPSPAADRDQVESTSWYDSIGNGAGYVWHQAKDFFNGEQTPYDASASEAGTPVPAGPPSNEVILRVIGELNGATPEDEAAIVARYGQAAVDAAKMRLKAGELPQ